MGNQKRRSLPVSTAIKLRQMAALTLIAALMIMSSGRSQEVAIRQPTPRSSLLAPIRPENPLSNPFQSMGQLNLFVGGDLESPQELLAAVNARSFEGELIFTVATEPATAWAANLILGLRKQGIDHTLVVTMKEQHCKILSSGPGQISCAWTSFITRRVGKFEPYRLDWAKHQLFHRLINLGINPMFIDADSTIQSNPYALTTLPLFANYHLMFASGEQGPFRCNTLINGFMYCKNCKPNGTSYSVYEGAVWRHNFRKVNWRTNVVMKEIAFLACCGKDIDDVKNRSLQSEEMACVWTNQDEGGLWHKPLLPSVHPGQPTSATNTHEGMVFAPAWLHGEFNGWGMVPENGGGGPASNGSFFRQPPAIAHFIGAEGGKSQYMKALGWWDFRADVVAADVAARKRMETHVYNTVSREGG